MLDQLLKAFRLAGYRAPASAYHLRRADPLQHLRVGVAPSLWPVDASAQACFRQMPHVIEQLLDSLSGKCCAVVRVRRMLY